ncbi:MAG: glycosyltransferase [Candidatus Izemoplasmataceae bacterium]
MRILFLNPQGNFDQHDSYWTEHPDFGGQLVYVKEIAIEIAKLGHQVDIVTRYINDPDFPAIEGTIDHYLGINNLRIVRIHANGEQFLPKEQLWEHLSEWVDNIIGFYQKEGVNIDFATGHYGDGGLACAILKDKMQIPYSFTGHSLGAQKFDKLYQSNASLKELERTYHFSKRLLAENTAMKYADVIFVSTSQEKDEQYTHELYQASSKDKNFVVASPGVNIETFAEYNGHNVDLDVLNKVEKTLSRDIDSSRKDLAHILLASRLDPKKNHIGLLEAYANDQSLQDKANVVISLRGVDNAFKNYSILKPNEQKIMDQMMNTIEKYELYGKVTFINILSQKELANTYRYFVSKQGIFCLTALYEPFGLAPIEAMSTGLPAVVTKYGGPSEVLKEDGKTFGVLIDVHSSKEIAKGIHKAIDEYEHYQQAGVQRVLTSYTWTATAKTYINAIKEINEPVKDVMIPTYFYSLNQDDLDQRVLKDYVKKV